MGEAGQGEGTRAFPRRNPQGAPPGRRSGDGARTASDETRSKGYRRALKQPTSAREEPGRKERTMSEREALVMEGTLFAQDPDGTPEEKREAPGAPDNELVFEGWGSRRLRDAMRIAMTIVRTRTKVTGCRLVSRRDDTDALVFASDSHRLAQVRISEVSRSTKKRGPRPGAAGAGGEGAGARRAGSQSADPRREWPCGDRTRRERRDDRLPKRRGVGSRGVRLILIHHRCGLPPCTPPGRGLTDV